MAVPDFAADPRDIVVVLYYIILSLSAYHYRIALYHQDLQNQQQNNVHHLYPAADDEPFPVVEVTDVKEDETDVN